MPSTPLFRGTLRALFAALLFGVTAPLVQRASAQAGPLASGCLLYLGAGLASLVGMLARGKSDAEPGLQESSLRRLLLVALLGGMVAPALLVLGLKRLDGASGALLLALEAPATLLLALAVYREQLGKRVALAACLIFAGGLLLAGRPGQSPALAGAALVFGATVAWAFDNVLSRPLAERDPLAVVAAKGALGASFSALAALCFRDHFPSAANSAALLAIGGLGYGVSLQLYLRAQRLIGAARTASVFAAAPFLGAGVAFVLGAPWPGLSFLIAAAMIGVGLYLHVSEHHGHAHVHAALDHEHAHTHDDGHHRHVHDPMPSGPHSHVHHHEVMNHEHEHSEDVHHRHPH